MISTLCPSVLKKISLETSPRCMIGNSRWQTMKWFHEDWWKLLKPGYFFFQVKNTHQTAELIQSISPPYFTWIVDCFVKTTSNPRNPATSPFLSYIKSSHVLEYKKEESCQISPHNEALLDNCEAFICLPKEVTELPPSLTEQFAALML